MILLSGFLLGVVGSLHCAGMCGPLMLWAYGRNPISAFYYQSGRVLMYAFIGLLLGLTGTGSLFSPIKPWISIGSGALMIVWVLKPVSWRGPAIVPYSWMNKAVGSVSATKSGVSRFLLGGLNGLLPCGILYAALLAALAQYDWYEAPLFMAAFGLGNLPMLLMLGFGVSRLAERSKAIKRWLPYGTALIGLMLILRGLELGIPYLSPAAQSACCH